MKNLIRKVVNKVVFPSSRLSYSQAGEDMIMDFLFYKLNIKKPFYLDIGANHPKLISNTYYFYLKGSSGVCIEANPLLADKIKKARPKDVVLAKGVGVTDGQQLDFYLYSGRYDGMSTFSKQEAEHWSTVGSKEVGKIQYDAVIKVPIISVNTVLERHCTKVPDLISLDIEGLDLDILKTINFGKHKPAVLCIETLKYDANQQEYKNEELIDFVKSKGYNVYADTYINTIFLSQSV